MFERLNEPQEAYNYKLGATLKMEQKVLDILDASIENAQDEQVVAAFRKHRGETEQHIENVQKVFGLFDWEVDDSPCPAIEGLEKEGKANAKKADEALVDSILLQGAVEVEHHEIGVYENLIINARAMGRDDVVTVLQSNIANEEQTLDDVKRLQERVAAVTPKAA
jgi:ferritin-like metal-binding protein YciE